MVNATVTSAGCPPVAAVERDRQMMLSGRVSLTQAVKQAALALDAPYGLLALGDGLDTLIATGFEGDTTATSFAAAIAGSRELTIVSDACLAPEWADCGCVSGAPFLRFVAVVPLQLPSGDVIGTLAVADRVPRTLTEAQRDALIALGQQAIVQLEQQRQLRVEHSVSVESVSTVSVPAPADRYLQALASVQQQVSKARDGGEAYSPILELLGTASGACRAFVFENHRDSDGRIFANQRAEWCAPGISSHLQNPTLQDLPYDAIAPAWIDRLASGRSVTCLAADLPPAGRAMLSERGTLALLLVPLHVRGRWFGFVGLDRCRTAQFWQATEVHFLSAAAAAIAAAIENQQTRQALQQQEAFVSCALEMELTGTWTWNAMTDTVTFDPALQVLMGLDAAALPETWAAWCARIHPDDRALWTQALQAHLNGVEPDFYCERRLIGPDGRVRWFKAVGSSQTNDRGHLLALSVRETNTTETKLTAELNASNQRVRELERQLEDLKRRDRSKDDFLNTVSHELRAPMSNMKLSIRMLALTLAENKRQQYLDILGRECDREIELVNDLLDLQRLDYRGDELSLRSIALAEWVAPIVQPFQLRAEQRQITLELAVDDTVATTEPHSLQRLLDELLHNACKYTPPAGKIVFATRIQGAMLSLAVSNTGNPIPAEHLPHIFDRFYRVPSSDRWHQGGTGLGLTLVQKLVERLGGSIEVTSDTESTTFQVHIPLLLEEPERQQEAATHLRASTDLAL